mgnify:CR=1 FL=1
MSAQTDDVFVVKKKIQLPEFVPWIYFEKELQTDKVYGIVLQNNFMDITADSIVCYKMTCTVNNTLFEGRKVILFGKKEVGKAFIVLYNKHKITGEWNQTNIRPVYFNDLKYSFRNR